MGELFRRGVVTIVAGLAGAALVWTSALAQGEPPARVARLAFIDGTVSLHDSDKTDWMQAIVNTPLTTGDSLWTEPTARSEVSLAGTRMRLDGATQLDLLAVDDGQTRLQLVQGRIDVKSFAMDANQPYEVVTPRGTVTLLQLGDYYVEAGSTEDPTRLGVRSGAARIEGLNGQILAVRPGEVAEVLGDAAAPQFRTVRTAPPAMPASWASRDRQVVYDPPQHVSAGMTGYEDLNAYGDWINDGSYGRVWAPRAVPSGWAPYRTGHWSYVQPWGWTWIDEQPWGFAPYHYGRWANSRDRWVWVPPQRDVRPVYAPALVAFVGGTELAASLASQSSAPVGWFPLGPREAYVPPYTANRDYYQRLNRSERIDDRILEDRWQRAARREAFAARNGQPLMNQRFATVVPTSAFVRSQPVMRSALRVHAQAIAATPVAPVAAPPAPTASVANAAVAPATPQPRAPTAPAPRQAPASDPKVQADAKANAEAELKTANVPVAKTAFADMPTLAKPTATERPAAPGPKVAPARPEASTDERIRQVAPTLAPRQGAAPPVLKGAVTPIPAQPNEAGGPSRQQQAAPQPQAAQPPVAPAAKPASPARQQATPEPPALPAPAQAKPTQAPKPTQAAPAPQPQQARPPEARRQQLAPPPPVRTTPAPQQQEGRAQPTRPVEAPRPTAAPQTQSPQPQRSVPPQPQPASPHRQAAPAQQQAAPQQRQAAPPPQQPRQPEQAQARPGPQAKGDDRKDDNRK